MSGAASSEQAATIVGLDLDDELQQLLKEQEDFLKQSKRPAAKVTRLGGGDSGVSAADTRHKKSNASQEEEKKSEEDADDATPSGPQILGSVVERDVIELNIQNVNVMPRAQATGFPAVQRRGESLFGKRARQPLAGGGAAKSASAAKPSRFSAMKKQQEQARAAAVDAVVERDAEAPSLDPERQEIDRTNRARLQEMSLDEIRQAQQELMMSLDPELVEKLMSKNKNTRSAKKSQAPPVEKRGTGAEVAVGKTIVKEDDCEDEEKGEKALMQQLLPAPAPAPTASIDLAKIQSEDELIEQAKLLPPEERAKHEWMQSVSKPAVPTASTKSDRKGKARKAKLQATVERFDFDGECISGIDQKQQPAHSGLFHHGDEPEAAGYTMAELLHLARSMVSSQRAMALTTITKILRKRTQCVGEQSDLSKVFPRVLPNDLPITMRIGLDDQNYTALSAAIGALHAFLVPSEVLSSSSQFSFEGSYGTVVAPPRIHLHQNVKEEGETLEKLKLSFETPQTEEVVYIDTSESPDDGSSISDEELTFLDPVQGFLNMDIGTRLRYILESIQLPDQSATEKMLDILIQIANHSPRAAKDIGTNAKLMKAIQRKFIENEDVLTLQEENEAALRLTVKALVLVRALCQGSRAVAVFLIGNGVIQSTKGFLAIQGSNGLSSSSLYSEIQLESLRIWRVLLKYGLDFHCFAYLFPILCGFRGADLVRPTGEIQESDKNDQKSSLLRRASVTAALFAALEVLCGLKTVHEAQHYFNQLDFFMIQARDEILTRLKSIGDGGIDGSGGDIIVIATALRFLSTTASLVTKFHLDASILTEVFQTLQSNATTQKALSVFATSSFLGGGEEALSAVVHFHLRVITNNLLSDDLDEDDATTQFFSLVKPHLHTSIANGLNTVALQSVHHVALVCDLLTSTGDLIISTKDFYDDAFVATIYAYGLKLMEKFVSGQEHLLSQLLTKLLFQPTILQRVGFFANEFDATAMSRVLIPIYQALVNTTPELESHSRRNCELIISSPSDKSSCQLRIPQYESEYIGSNLPLPGFWMFCPFSRMEFSSNTSGQGDKRKPPSGPTRAESDEMKLIVSATCRYLYQLETATTSSSASSSWKNVVVSYQSEMRGEDKLFHLLHVFFAGADVLFDEHVDTALSQLLKNFALPVLKSKENGTVLYDGILRNLRRFQHLDPNFSGADANAAGDNGVSFSSDEQIVMTFVEKLVADFTSLSYGNVHFARCVTLLLTSDFPIAIRKWVWKELQDCHLLHMLQPFDAQDELKSHATFARCATLDKKIHDEQLLQLMKQALVQKQISMDKGAFAYKLAIHHVTVYLFGPSDSHSRGQPLTTSMSFSRQLLAQDLAKDTPSHVWRHLLTYEPSDVSGSAAFDSEHNTAIKPERVQRMETQAGLSPDQLAAFRTLIDTVAE